MFVLLFVEADESTQVRKSEDLVQLKERMKQNVNTKYDLAPGPVRVFVAMFSDRREFEIMCDLNDTVEHFKFR